MNTTSKVKNQLASQQLLQPTLKSTTQVQLKGGFGPLINPNG